jgi:hypothetical protein
VTSDVEPSTADLHCRTWTSPVELGKCLDAIREHAFVSTPYPVILTLEDHLTSPLQAKVAKVTPISLRNPLLLRTGN